jgi:hypothetical protein
LRLADMVIMERMMETTMEVTIVTMIGVFFQLVGMVMMMAMETRTDMATTMEARTAIMTSANSSLFETAALENDPSSYEEVNLHPSVLPALLTSSPGTP